MRINRGGYLIREGFRSIGTHAFMSFATVTIIIACLIIMGTVSLLSINIDSLIKNLEDQNEVVAFVDENYDEASAEAVGESILAIDNIYAADFVNRDEAMESFMSNYSSDLMEGIDSEVFRHRFVIHLTDISLMAQTKAELESIEGIAKVNAHIDYADTFVQIRNIVSIVSFALIAMLVFVSVFIMSNTIKLATYGRRDEIAIMKMVGAGNGFIRMPFVIEGLVLGILGGGLAFVAEWAIYDSFTEKLVQTITGSLFSFIPFAQVSNYVLAAFLGVGIIVGAFGGVNAIRNYLKV